MKPCFTKLCTAQRQVFCSIHQAILCYGCKDEFHHQCQVDEIVDPSRITQNITQLLTVLETITEDQSNFCIEMHIEGLEEFVHTNESKIDEIQHLLSESVTQDRFLEYTDLLEDILKVRTMINESKVYQEYCNFMINFKAKLKLLSEQELEIEEENIDTRAAPSNIENQNATSDYLNELSKATKFVKLYEKVMECSIHESELQELIINCDINKDKKLMKEILTSNTKVSNLKCLTIQNCNKNLSEVSKFLSHSLLKDINKIKLVCNQQGPKTIRKIKPILPALTSAVQFMNVKEVHLSDWEFDSKDLNVLIDSCSGVETISIQRAFFCSWNGMKLDRNRIFRTKILKLSPTSFQSFASTTTDSIIHAIGDSNLKESLNELHIRGISSHSISSLETIADSLGMSHIKLII
ncbi:unnamed protein product [Moneuplotes crassus]|uniref:Uncharacterized protein n=1 Tax=Euplotes crassus TaxID=5936 RepID=A0AAD1UGH3_EUPCR|nr:unnamed protein product [Moneuplotes crassus]